MNDPNDPAYWGGMNLFEGWGQPQSPPPPLTPEEQAVREYFAEQMEERLEAREAEEFVATYHERHNPVLQAQWRAELDAYRAEQRELEYERMIGLNSEAMRRMYMKKRWGGRQRRTKQWFYPWKDKGKSLPPN